MPAFSPKAGAGTECRGRRRSARCVADAVARNRHPQPTRGARRGLGASPNSAGPTCPVDARFLGQSGTCALGHRLVVRGIICRYRAGVPWHDPGAHRFLEDRAETPPPLRRRWHAGRCRRRSRALPRRRARSNGRFRWTPRSTVPSSTAPTACATPGVLPNDKNPHQGPRPRHRQVPRSAEHQDPLSGWPEQRPLVAMLGPRQGLRFPEALPPGTLRATNPATVRTRRRPERAMADKAYAARGNRKHLRDRGIQCAAPERTARRPTGNGKCSAGGRPPATCDKDAYKCRNKSRAQLQCPEPVARAGEPVRQARPGLPLCRGAPGRGHLERSPREIRIGTPPGRRVHTVSVRGGDRPLVVDRTASDVSVA